MKDKSGPIEKSLQVFVIAVFAFMGCISFGQDNNYALLVQPSPVDGGLIEPGAGVHRAQLDDTVTFTAVANPGYRFVCWLGDVSEEEANQTTVFVDGPKIIIAVFQRSEFELPEVIAMAPGAGRGGASGYSAYFYMGPSISPGTAGPDWDWPVYDNGDDDIIDDFPVPDDDGEDDFPVPDEPIPEPLTVVLLGLGGGLMRAVGRRRKRRK